MDLEDYYSLLELPPTAKPEEIRAALDSEQRKWARRSNSAPDPEDRMEAERITRALSHARRTLLDPALRAEYDRSRRAPAPVREERDPPRRPAPGPPTPPSPPSTPGRWQPIAPPAPPGQPRSWPQLPIRLRGARVGRGRKALAIFLLLAIIGAVDNANKKSHHAHAKSLPRATRSAYLDQIKSHGESPDSRGAAMFGGRSFSHALVYHGDSSPATFRLRRGYRRFTVLVAVADCQLDCTDVATRFTITVNGHSAAVAEVGNGESKRISARLHRGDRIKLSASYLKTFPGDASWYWLDPKLVP